MPERQVGRVLPLWLVVLLGVAGTAGAFAGIHSYREILGPIIPAFVLTVVAHPLIGSLVRRGLRRGLAIAVAVVLVDGGLIAFALALALSFGQLATVLPQYSDEAQHLLDGLRSTLSDAGIGFDQVEKAIHSIEPSSVLSAVRG